MTENSGESLEFVITDAQAGMRVDKVLAGLATDLTRSAVQKLVREGRVTADCRQVKASDKVSAGQTLRIDQPPQTPPPALEAEKHLLDVVYEDDGLLIINKPPGMVVHPSRGHDSGTLVNALLGYCTLSTAGEAWRPGIVHRLDRDTSGLLLVAKNNVLHGKLSALVENHQVQRVYRALVWGVPQHNAGLVDTHMGRHPLKRTMMAVLPEGKGRRARTRYTVLEEFCLNWHEGGEERPRERRAALIECRLETGRTHQIRVHLHHLGCPIIGDPVYGDAERDAAPPDELAGLVAALPGQALHAGRMLFTHPQSGAVVDVEAAAPSGFNAVLQWLGNNT